MFSVKGFKDQFAKRKDELTEGSSVQSGFICPGCYNSFSEEEQLLTHVNTCPAITGGEATNGVHDPNHSPRSHPKEADSNAAMKALEVKSSKLAQENVKYRARCDEQSSIIESLQQAFSENERILNEKLKYITKLEDDILKYEEQGDDVGALSNQLHLVQQSMNDMLISHMETVGQLRSDLDESRKLNESLSASLNERDNTICELESRIEKMKSVEDHSTQSPNEDTSGSDDSRELVISLRKDLDERSSRLKALEGELGDKKALLDSQNTQILCLQQQVEELQSRLERGCVQCSDYEKKIVSIQKVESEKCKTLQERLSAVETELEKARESFMTNEKLVDQISEQSAIANDELKRQLVEKQSETDCLEKEVQSLRSRVQELEPLEAKLEAAICFKSEMAADLSKKTEALESVKRDLEQSQARCSELTNQVEEGDKSVFTLQHQVNILQSEKQEQVESLQSQVDLLTGNLNHIRMELADKESQNEEQNSLLNQNLSSLRLELSEKSEELCQALSQLTQLRKECETMKANVAKVVKERDGSQRSLNERNMEFDRLRTHYVELRTKYEDAQKVMFELGREQLTLQVEKAKYFDRFWIADKDVSNCEKCEKEFTATNRKHHCRSCGRIFCNDCSSKRAKLPAHPSQVRVCDPCFQNLPS